MSRPACAHGAANRYHARASAPSWPRPDDVNYYLPIEHKWVESRHAPLYELTFPVRATDAQISGLCTALENWHAHSHYPYAFVFDLSKVSEATPVQRALFREHMARVRDHDAAFHKGVGLVVPSAFLRGLVTASFWFVPPKYPHALFANRDLAFAWAKDRLEAAQRSSSIVPC
jgi:hypothetical protein